jgi:acyl-coenzyme A thioesterase PaaI-like protein
MATVQLDVHFVDAGNIGDILTAKPRVIRVTRSLVFVTVEVKAKDRTIITANGVFKILKDGS